MFASPGPVGSPGLEAGRHRRAPREVPVYRFTPSRSSTVQTVTSPRLSPANAALDLRAVIDHDHVCPEIDRGERRSGLQHTSKGDLHIPGWWLLCVAWPGSMWSSQMTC